MTVKHQRIWQVLETSNSDDAFLEGMHAGLVNLIETAELMEYHVDWSTLTIQPEESIVVTDAAGNDQEYGQGLRMVVDSIQIQEDDE